MGLTYASTAILVFLCSFPLAGQNVKSLTPQERRGSITAERIWWDLLHYELSLEVFPETRSIRGKNTVTFKVLSRAEDMQIDLQKPLRITAARLNDGRSLTFRRDGNAFFLSMPATLAPGSEHKVTIDYEGVPAASRNPPWSGGFSWKKDRAGQHFIATSCQGIGASIWWPNKDHGYDEPDRGMTLHATVPEPLAAVGNGRLTRTTHDRKQKKSTWTWTVTQPINNYAVNLNIGDYTHFEETIRGEAGPLDMDYWVLKQDIQRAKKQFREAPRVMEAFEYWFGPYPFYEDSFKIVQVPYLGMEHQSSVAYGNGFRNGYRGTDLSGTGVGLKFDFIIVHESAHEWWGNNISMKDAADMWIHEGFANYAEALFVEYFFTRSEADRYVRGLRRNIRNDIPIIGLYGLNKSGSGDMYYKGANMLHTLRQIIDNDRTWRHILRGLNRKFRHRTVSTGEVEAFIAKESGHDLKLFFEQYLRRRRIPEISWKIRKRQLHYRFSRAVEGLKLPVKVWINGEPHRLMMSQSPATLEWKAPIRSVSLDPNYYMLAPALIKGS